MLARQSAPALVSAVFGLTVGLASSSVVAGLMVFFATGLLVNGVVDVGEQLARHSPARWERVTQARLRRAGITEWRFGGGGNVFSEPVLVCWHGLRKHEVYDQHGKLLATGRVLHEPGGVLRRDLLKPESLAWSGPDGRALLTVCLDRGWNPRLYIATGSDGTVLGTVTMSGKEKGLISAAGETVGYLRRQSMRRRLRRHHAHFNLFDTSLLEVGRVTHEHRFVSWTVIEIEGQVAGSLRNLLLAVGAAVGYWETPKGGGGGG